LDGYLVERTIKPVVVPIFAGDVGQIWPTSFLGVLADDNFAQNTRRYGNLLSGAFEVNGLDGMLAGSDQ